MRRRHGNTEETRDAIQPLRGLSLAGDFFLEGLCFKLCFL